MGKAMNSKNGFTLVELLIAIVIVGVTIVVITAFLKNSLLMRSDSRGAEMAYLTGQEKLVELDAMVSPVSSTDTVFIDGNRYIRSWVITYASGSSLLSTATVTVQYEFMGRKKSLKCTGGLN